MNRQALISRRIFTGGTVLAAATLAVPALRAQSRLEKTKIAMAVGGKAAFYYLPLTISEQLGYFKAEGLEVEISDFAGGARALQAVVGGSADVCSGAFEHTINLQSKNQMFQAFVLQGRAPQIAFGVSTKTMPNYRTIADLKGKRIGVSAPGSSTNMMANLVLSRAGLKASDVSFIGVGTAAGALTALRSGQIDAMSNTDPVMTMLEQKNEVKIISDTRTLKGTLEVFGGPMPAACLYAPMDFIQKHPNTCQALANAIVHGLKWLQTAGPGDIIKTVPDSYLLGDRGLYLASFNKVRESISLDGIIPDDGARTALKALASFDPSIKADKIDLAKTYTNEFARQAKERFKA
ncbi:NitT/TauT family transport system substrate-binding protein [Polaromonas sp. OV174]|uniref:ABC transporter substrate-binding protein n=1 Tax=Polaromonas sp. OV174 TaxID=1855300 RepID=UPI0008EA9E0E|nr:ABC transporter substrate-binding protein [Polaromonas sp. OV174]SFC36478.1 NitT/TauT family transport system substrate-binding protein [Polaromonas sp. OV174]